MVLLREDGDVIRKLVFFGAQLKPFNLLPDRDASIAANFPREL